MANIVTVELRNPPSEATFWHLVLTDWDMTVAIDEASGKDRLDITEVATFEIPGGLVLPLRVASLQITKWNEDMTALIQLYYAQSMHPTLWDWDNMEYGDEPDPTYKEVFIPELGSYYFDVAAEELVFTGAAPVTQDWYTPLIVMALLMGMAATLVPAMKEGFG